MYLLPAIDLLQGSAVRLAKGDYNAVTVYNTDPVAQSLDFASSGAEWIHVVDLEGARLGVPVHTDIIKKIISETGLKVEVGGGVRSFEAIETLVDAGAARVVLGTKLAHEPDFAREAISRYGELICAGIDARSGDVAIEGWNASSGVLATALVSELASLGIRHLVYTDINKDGMQTGIDADAYRKIADVAGFAVTASGGVATLDDLRALAALGNDVVDGVIAGRAIYEGAFTVKEALEAIQSVECSTGFELSNDTVLGVLQ